MSEFTDLSVEPHQMYLDPASGRHYTPRPDGTTRWLTGPEEAALAWLAATEPVPAPPEEPSPRSRGVRSRGVRSRGARPGSARHAGPFDEAILDAPPTRSAARSARPRRSRRRGVTALAGLFGVVAGGAFGVGLTGLLDLTGGPPTAALRPVAVGTAAPPPAATVTVGSTVTRTLTRTSTRTATVEGPDPRFDSCRAAIAAGYGDYRRGADPEYAWYRDRDGDGIACETAYPGDGPPRTSGRSTRTTDPHPRPTRTTD